MTSRRLAGQLACVLVLLLVGLTLTTMQHSALAAGGMRFAAPFSLSVPKPFWVGSEDMDADGFEDICAYSEGNVAIFYGRGNGTFNSPVFIPSGVNVDTEWAHTRSVDLNGDSLPDLAVTCGVEDYMSVRMNLGNRTYGPQVIYPTGDRPRGIVDGDFDHDGDKDLLVANHYSHNLAFYRNLGTGALAPPVFYPATGLSGTVTVADFNRDGDLDAAMSAYVSDEVRIFLGNGDGTFQVGPDYKVGGVYPGSILSGDMNGDGNVDLVTSNAWSANATLLIGNGNGGFSVQSPFPVVPFPHIGEAADFDGDGDLDLCFPSFGESVLAVVENNGNGQMKPAVLLASTGLEARCSSTGDFNGDGNPDVVISNQITSNLSVYLNASGPRTPSSPAQLTAVAASSSQVNLSWMDRSTNETGFRIERRTNGAYAVVGTAGASPGTGPATYIDNAGLTANTTYTYRVQAFNAAGGSNFSNEATTSTLAPALPEPTNLVATAASISQINLGWQDNSVGETGFEIERRTISASFSRIHTTAPNINTYQDTSLAADTVYIYRVRGLGPVSPTPYSNEAATTTFAIVLETPQSLTATAVSHSQVNLAWQDLTNLETNYEIQRQQGSGSFQSLPLEPANTTVFQDTNLAPDTQYAYRVRAVRGALTSLFSNIATTGTPLKPLTAPLNLEAGAVTSSQLRLNWIDTSDFETGFEVERKTSGSVYEKIGTVGASAGMDATAVYTDASGLMSNTTYFYRVRAVAGTRFSAYSNEASSTTTPLIPSAPSGLTATVTATNTITLNWSDNSVNETGFRVERRTNGGSFTHIGDGAADFAQFVDPALAADTLYTYRLRAVGTAGDSAYTNEAATPTPPTAPTNLSFLVPAAGQIRINWLDNSSSETGFKVERSTGGGAFLLISTTSTDATTYLDTGLPGGTGFIYRVRATNAGGNSSPSNAVNALTLPAAPTSLSVFAYKASRLELGWTSANPSPPSVKIERSTNGANFTQIGTANPGSNAYTDTTVAASATYYYRVRATNSSGDSEYSSVASATSLPSAPSVPAVITASATTARSVQLSWQDTSTTETAFEIYRLGPQDSSYQLIAALGENVNNHLDAAGLAGNTTYNYRMRASNAGGASAFTAVVTVTTPADVPVRPNEVAAASVSSSRIQLTWRDNSDNETGFRIERKPSGGTFAVVHTTAADVVEYQDQGLLESTTYTYRVAALGAQADSLPSVEASGTTRPQAPGGLLTVSGNRRIDLQWTDQSALDTGFRVERKAVGGVFAALGTTGAGVTTYVDTTPVPGTPYTYRVIALSQAGDSGPSNESTATARNETPLAKLVIAPKAVNFGTVRLVSSKQKTFKLTNKGKESLHFVVGTLSAPFSIVSGGGAGQLAPKQSRVVTVRLAPSAAGKVTALLRVTSTDPRAAQADVKLSGNGR